MFFRIAVVAFVVPKLIKVHRPFLQPLCLERPTNMNRITSATTPQLSTNNNKELQSSAKYVKEKSPCDKRANYGDDDGDDDDDCDELLDKDTVCSLLEEIGSSKKEEAPSYDPSTLTPGTIEGFYIVKRYVAPSDEFDLFSSILEGIDKQRLGLERNNVTLPVALMLLDPDEYPTLSRARKACRKGNIVIMERKGGSLTQRGKVADRIAPTDVIGRQERLSHGAYSTFLGNMGPPFELPVVYEDDHFAIVNKPSGVVVYDNGGFGSESKGRKHGRNTIKYALPFVLTPPPSQKQQSSRGLWRPIACHRLDKPTSGLLVVAKTRDAATHVTRQFEERIVQKTYTAIVDGSPLEDFDSSISSMKVYELGGEVDPTSNSRWQIDEGVQEGKEATTFWRTLKHARSVKGKDGYLTVVELKPKTGRKHQLRRVMAWSYGCPIVGDKTYSTVYGSKKYGRGLMLCSNRIKLLHPYYNTPEGKEEWKQLGDDKKLDSGMLHESEDGQIWVQASIELPNKFEIFLASEDKRYQHNNSCN